MNNKNLLALIKTDRELKAIFIGMVVCGLLLLVSAITASMVFLK